MSYEKVIIGGAHGRAIITHISRMTQFLRDQASDSEEAVTSLISPYWRTSFPFSLSLPAISRKGLKETIGRIFGRDSKAGTIRKKLPLDAINPAHESLS